MSYPTRLYYFLSLSKEGISEIDSDALRITKEAAKEIVQEAKESVRRASWRYNRGRTHGFSEEYYMNPLTFFRIN